MTRYPSVSIETQRVGLDAERRKVPKRSQTLTFCWGPVWFLILRMKFWRHEPGKSPRNSVHALRIHETVTYSKVAFRQPRVAAQAKEEEGGLFYSAVAMW